MLSPSKLLLPVLLTLASAFPLYAKVISLSLEELINRSELVVVAKVEKISVRPTRAPLHLDAHVPDLLRQLTVVGPADNVPDIHVGAIRHLPVTV